MDLKERFHKKQERTAPHAFRMAAVINAYEFMPRLFDLLIRNKSPQVRHVI